MASPGPQHALDRGVQHSSVALPWTCRRCGERDLHPSRCTSRWEARVRAATPLVLYRCHACGHRGWHLPPMPLPSRERLAAVRARVASARERIVLAAGTARRDLQPRLVSAWWWVRDHPRNLAIVAGTLALVAAAITTAALYGARTSEQPLPAAPLPSPPIAEVAPAPPAAPAVPAPTAPPPLIASIDPTAELRRRPAPWSGGGVPVLAELPRALGLEPAAAPAARRSPATRVAHARRERQASEVVTSTSAWRRARWGMTVQEVASGFPGGALTVRGGATLPGTLATAFTRTSIRSRAYAVALRFDRRHRLGSIELVPVAPIHDAATAYDEVAGWIAERGGPPASSRAERSPSGSWTRTASWRTPESRIELRAWQTVVDDAKVLQFDLQNGAIKPAPPEGGLVLTYEPAAGGGS